VAVTDVWVEGGGLTTRGVVPDEGARRLVLSYWPVIVSFPTGAAAESHEPVPPESVAVHRFVEPAMKVTEPVGVPGPVVSATVAAYVTALPAFTGFGVAVMDVVVAGGGLTVRGAVPDEAAKRLVLRYTPVTVSVPTVAAVELHCPVPFERIAVHRLVEPTENVTEPMGVPDAVVTVAPYVTGSPEFVVPGTAVIDVSVEGGGLMTRRVLLDPENTLSPEYVPVIVTLPSGVSAELHDPVPFDSVAVHSGVEPAVNATAPVGVGIPATDVVTDAE
jgi:hypothetical protein